MGMIIDAHTHIHPDPKGFGEKYDASLESLISSIENSDVDKAILLPISPLVSNEFIAESCKKYQDKLIGFASVDPLDSESPDKLTKDVKKFNLKGLKLHPRMQNFSLADPNILPVLQRASDLGLPMVIDAFPYSSNVLIKDTLPLLIDELAHKIPNGKFIIAHMGGYRLWDGLFVAKGHKNVYLDISYTLLYFQGSSIANDIKFIIKKAGANKCIYGSDHPEMELSVTYERSLKILKSFDLSKNEMNLIFGGTIESLLGV